MKLRSRLKSTLVLRLRSSARLFFLPRVIVAEISTAELEVLIGLVIVAAAQPLRSATQSLSTSWPKFLAFSVGSARARSQHSHTRERPHSRTHSYKQRQA